MYKKPFLFTVIFVFMAAGLFANENPEAVSPGHELKASVVDGVCPTFSWAQVPGASAYQIAVFETNERYEGLSYYENQASLSSLVLIKKISGSAFSWTPSMEEALSNGGRYVWFVQAQDAYGTGPWSVGKKFAVRAPMGLTEIKEKVREQLEARGIEADLVDEAFEGIQSQDIKSKSRGELKGKGESLEEQEAQTKLKMQGSKEIKGKENQITGGARDFTAGALGSENDGNYNVYYGSGAGNSLPGDAFGNSFFGYQAGYSNNDGDGNTFIGLFAGDSNTTGGGNTFMGASTGNSNITGNNNTFIGFLAGYWNTSGSANIFLGYKAGYYETGSDRLYIENSDSSAPLIYGEFDNDLVNINGQLNVVDGGYLGLTGSTNQITIDTTSSRARFKLQADGGGVNQDDFFNFTMRNDYGDVTLSVRDSSAGVWLPMLSYEYLNSKVDFKNNDIVTTGTISSGGGAYTSGGAWIEASSRDYKENIMELDQDESVQALEQLNPVRYNYKNNHEEEFLGFIAEDVPDLVAMNGRKGMRAMDIVAVLTKVVQNQQKKIDEQKDKNIKQDKVLKDQNELLKKQNKLISKLIKKIEELERK